MLRCDARGNLGKISSQPREKGYVFLLHLGRLGCKCVGSTTRRRFMYRRENARVLGRMYMANFVKGSDSENPGFASECMRGIKKTYENRRSMRLYVCTSYLLCLVLSYTMGTEWERVIFGHGGGR